MSNLKSSEIETIRQIFESDPGYVLDFNNRTFSEFFWNDVGVDIDDPTYFDSGKSKMKRFRTFLQKAQKQAVVLALNELWSYRQKMMQRKNQSDTVPNAANDLAKIVERLGGDPSAIRSNSVNQERDKRQIKGFSELYRDFNKIQIMDPKSRGLAFEKFLNALFVEFDLSPRQAFKIRGEQIDGSFLLDGAVCLLEAKWENQRTKASDLYAFQGKVDERPEWTRGLFLSYTGFTEEALDNFRPRKIILMDCYDLFITLHDRIPLDDVLREKFRKASERKLPLARVRDLFG